jgi:hypothetical protein
MGIQLNKESLDCFVRALRKTERFLKMSLATMLQFLRLHFVVQSKSYILARSLDRSEVAKEREGGCIREEIGRLQPST